MTTELLGILILIACEAIIIIPTGIIAAKVGFLWRKHCSSIPLRRCAGAVYVALVSALIVAYTVYVAVIGIVSFWLLLVLFMVSVTMLLLEVLNIWYEILPAKKQITLHNHFFKTVIAFGKKWHLKRFTKWCQFYAGAAWSMKYHGKEYQFSKAKTNK